MSFSLTRGTTGADFRMPRARCQFGAAGAPVLVSCPKQIGPDLFGKSRPLSRLWWADSRNAWEPSVAIGPLEALLQEHAERIGGVVAEGVARNETGGAI